jgi:hypothetical protein
VFLERYLPSKYEPDDPIIEAVRDLFIPFLRWTAGAADLPPASWPYFKAKAEHLLKSFPSWKAKDPDMARFPRPRSL